MSCCRLSLGVSLVVLFCLMTSGTALPVDAQERRRALPATNWADWIEPDFPFFSSVLDARRAGSGLRGAAQSANAGLPAVAPGAKAGFATDNLTPRGLVLNLGRGYWVGFDTDLLRVAAMWRGHAVTPKALAPGSYHNPDRKTPGGQFPAPEPDGQVLLANGIYPGWQSGDRISFDDPREPAPSPEEVGRGPLPEAMGRFTAVRLVRGGVVLEYVASGAAVREWLTIGEHAGQPVLERHVEVGPAADTLSVVLGAIGKDAALSVNGAGVSSSLDEGSHVWSARVPPHTAPIRFSAALVERGPAPSISPRAIPNDLPASRWPQEIVTAITPSTAQDAYVIDDIALPLENPWRRNVRPGDVQFLQNGTGVVVTLDGDVWTVEGLRATSGKARWRRFTSGLHEPLTLAIRDDQVYVFDRNGIWRLRDSDGNGEADVHELFSNAFAQTADMREFPNTIRPAPAGEFVIAKGNQQATTIGRHNGHVLRISADGRHATVLGYGFRQPNIGVNVRTGLVTASDQQGHYIPTTPLHIVRDAQFYGFLSDKLPREVYPAPIAEPLTWIPHTANASAMSQVWLFGARMGPLNDALVHIGFNKPELLRVLFNERGSRPQAAVVTITRAFEFPPLNGSVNPADGQLYLTGFQILGWGTTATKMAGLGRVRYTGAPSTVPREVVAMDKGVLIRFDVELDGNAAADPDNYSITSWDYKRTYKYGSPHYKADGTAGIDRLAPSSAYLSTDRRAVFVGVPDMTPVMQMRVGWSLATASGMKFEENAYFTPYELASFDPGVEGFGELTVDLSPRTAAVNASAPVSAEEGRRLYQAYGCMACHSSERGAAARLGPAFHGLYGAERTFARDVVRIRADEAYIRESIVEPSAKVVSGYELGGAGMPSYAGVLTDSQIESIILFIKTLR